jgi:hypothetical protein
MWVQDRAPCFFSPCAKGIFHDVIDPHAPEPPGAITDEIRPFSLLSESNDFPG